MFFKIWCEVAIATRKSPKGLARTHVSNLISHAHRTRACVRVRILFRNSQIVKHVGKYVGKVCELHYMYIYMQFCAYLNLILITFWKKKIMQ